MADRVTEEELTRWVVAAAAGAAAKTDAETVVLDVGDVLGVAGWFVITSGSNARQVKAIVDEVEARVAEAGGGKPVAVEGRDAMQWVLISYGDIVVHVFDDEARAYYDLERLWADVPTLDWQAAVAG